MTTTGATDVGHDLVEMRVADVRRIPSSENPDRSVVLLEEVAGPGAWPSGSVRPRRSRWRSVSPAPSCRAR